MAFEGDNGEVIPHRRRIFHYHGDEVRVLFVVSALVLLVAQSTGVELPFSTFGAVLIAVILVIAAGITNASQVWIHWFNALLAVGGTLVFGTDAVHHYRAGMSVFDSSFALTEALALLSLLSLYFTTRTIRGIILRMRSL